MAIRYCTRISINCSIDSISREFKISAFIIGQQISDALLRFLTSSYLYVHHTDAKRELVYNRESHIDRLGTGLGQAKTEGWTIVDIEHGGRYIIYNPIRVGLAKTIKEYSHWDAYWV